MPIYWPHDNRPSAGLPAVWPGMVAPLSRQNPGYLPTVLLTLLESPAKGRGAADAEGKSSGTLQDFWSAASPSPAHRCPMVANGFRCDSCLARLPEEPRLSDHTERPEFRS